jgi:hypothetical protein
MGGSCYETDLKDKVTDGAIVSTIFASHCSLSTPIYTMYMSLGTPGSEVEVVYYKS